MATGGRPPARAALTEALAAAKRRSGRTYAALAARSGISRSALHRYCTGASIPGQFGIVERIAGACGSDRAELLRLHRWWLLAQQDGDPPTESDPRPASQPPPTPPPRPGTHRSRPRAPAALLAAAILLVIALAVPGAQPAAGPATPLAAGAPAQPMSATAQQVSGPDWVGEERVHPAFFGVTINATGPQLPTSPVGSLRLWDSRTRWANVQPTPTTFDWHILDRLVDAAGAARLPVLYVFGGTPEWAAPDGPLTAYSDSSRTAPPHDLAAWEAFVRAVVERFRGRIEAYELWNLADDPHYYTGDERTLAELARRAGRVVHEVDPHATVLCPSRGALDTPAGQDRLRQFAALGGYHYCDAAAVKLGTRLPAEPPETMLDTARIVDDAFHRAGVHPPLWNTGTGYLAPLQPPVDEATAVAYATRFYLVGLYLRYQRMYFYAWGSRKLPIVLQAEGGPPTAAARAVGLLQRYLAGGRLLSCSHGAATGLPDGVFHCQAGGAGGLRDVWWSERAAAVLPRPPGLTTVIGIDTAGAPSEQPAGPAIRVGPTPVFGFSQQPP